MKRSKRLYILLGVLVVVCAATFAVTRMEEEKEQISTSGEIILELSADEVQALSWEYDETSLGFHKDDGWLYDGDEEFPVNEEKIHELLEPFEAFGVSFIIEDVTDFSMYGLDDPVCTIRLETEGETYEIKLGEFSSMDSERYISIGDGNVYLAKQDPLDQFDVILADMIDYDDNLAYDQVSQIQFEGVENYSVFYEENRAEAYCSEDVYFVQGDTGNLPLDTGRVSSYLSCLTQLTPRDYVTYHATEEDLQSYGLNDPELTVTVEYTTQNEDGEEISDTFKLSLSRDPEELAAAQEDTEDDEEEEITAYARIGESRIIYKISADTYQKLMAASYDDLRHREVFSADLDDIYQVDVALEDAEYSICADGQKDDRGWLYQEEEVEMDDFLDSLEDLRADSADSFTSDAPTGKKEIGMTIYLENENHPEVELAFYRYDGDDCLAVVDGQPFALIDRADVVDLIEAVNTIVLN